MTTDKQVTYEVYRCFNGCPEACEGCDTISRNAERDDIAAFLDGWAEGYTEESEPELRLALKSFVSQIREDQHREV